VYCVIGGCHSSAPVMQVRLIIKKACIAHVWGSIRHGVVGMLAMSYTDTTERPVSHYHHHQLGMPVVQSFNC